MANSEDGQGTQGKIKVFQKVVAGMEKSETIHPSGEEKESFDLFKSLPPQDKEEQLQERGFGTPDICTSEEFAQRGVSDALKGKQLKPQASRIEVYDPNNDECKFGCCMRTFLCLFFCSC